MESEDKSPDDIIGSKYNSGLDKIYTIGTIRKGLHDFKIKRQPREWYDTLRSYRSEINSKFKQEEKDKCDDYHKVLEYYFNKKRDTILFKGETIEIEKLTEWTVDNILYEYELYLGELQEKYKMGMPDADDDEGL